MQLVIFIHILNNYTVFTLFVTTDSTENSFYMHNKLLSKKGSLSKTKINTNNLQLIKFNT